MSSTKQGTTCKKSLHPKKMRLQDYFLGDVSCLLANDARVFFRFSFICLRLSSKSGNRFCPSVFSKSVIFSSRSSITSGSFTLFNCRIKFNLKSLDSMLGFSLSIRSKSKISSEMFLYPSSFAFCFAQSYNSESSMWMFVRGYLSSSGKTNPT
jgi:hypothetical protein